jgi:hypothetical protein
MNTMTMTATVFDTLTFAKRLKAAGFNDQQAEAQAEGIAEIIENNIATKDDLKVLEAATKREIKELEAVTKQDIKELEERMQQQFTQLDHRVDMLGYKLTIRLGSMLGGMLIIAVTVLAAIIKL